MILYDHIFEPYQDLHIRTNLTLRPSLLRLLMTEIPPSLCVEPNLHSQTAVALMILPWIK